MMGAILMSGGKFTSEQAGITIGAQQAISDAMGIPFVLILPSILQRHFNGDWGNVCAEDAKANEDALRFGTRILSIYHVNAEGFCGEDEENAVKLYVITEWDRSITTILLPSEY